MRNRCMRCCCMNNNIMNMPNHCNNTNLIENCCNNVESSVQNYNDNCGCGFDDNYMDVFPELVSPYEPCDSMRQIAFLERTNSIGEGCNE